MADIFNFPFSVELHLDNVPGGWDTSGADTELTLGGAKTLQGGLNFFPPLP